MSPEPRSLEDLRQWLRAASLCIVPGAIAALGGIAFNGGHALRGPLEVAVNVVLVLSLVSSLAVVGIGFSRFLSAQSRARRARDASAKADKR